MTLHDYNIFCPNHYFYSRDETCYRCVEGEYFSCLGRRCVKDRLGPSVIGYLAHLVARRTRAYHKLARIIVPSRFLLEKASAAGYAEEQVTFLSPAVKIKKGELARKEKYFLYAGRLASQKGVDVLIQAVGFAGPKVRLRIAGEGPEEEPLRRVAADYAAGQVEFLGRLDARRLAEEMASARAVVVPSRWPENTPVVIMEALAAGAPVVGARVGGVPEMITDGVEGYLFEAEEVRELAGILEHLAADGRRARKLGRAAQDHWERAFSFRDHVTGLLELYREVAA